MLKLLILLFFVEISQPARHDAVPIIDTKQQNVVNVPKCRFSVHKESPNGREVAGTVLDESLYYNIQCEPKKDQCLFVSNCTVRADEPGASPFEIINDKGCSLDVSLFSHVQYRSASTAGIANPIPVRFRGSSSAVQMFCVTTSKMMENGKCKRDQCE